MLVLEWIKTQQATYTLSFNCFSEQLLEYI